MNTPTVPSGPSASPDPRSPSPRTLDAGGARRRRALALAAIAVAAAATHANSLPNEFVWDDVAVVEHNPAIRDLGYLRGAFSASYWAGAGVPWQESHYRPLTIASFVLSHAAGARSPGAYRAVNVTLHAAGAVLLAAIALELGLPLAGALLAGMIFAVHPVNVEAVAWVVGRAEVAATCLALAALLAWLRAFRGRSVGLAAVAGLLLLAGLLFKESAVGAVGIAAAAALVSADGPLRRRLRVAAAWSLPLLMAVAAYFALRRAMLGPARYADAVYFAGVGPWSTFLTMSKVVAYYLKLLLFPVELRAHYDLVDVRLARSLLEPMALGAVLLEASLLAAVAWGLVARRAWALAGAWILSALLPYLHIVPFQWLMAERFLYLATGGFALLVGLGVAAAWPRLAGHAPGRRALVAAATALVVALATRTVVRNGDWADEVAFFGKMTAQEPDLAIAHVMMANALMKRGRVAEAMERYRIASALGWRPGAGAAAPPLAR